MRTDNRIPCEFGLPCDTFRTQFHDSAKTQISIDSNVTYLVEVRSNCGRSESQLDPSRPLLGFRHLDHLPEQRRPHPQAQVLNGRDHVVGYVLAERRTGDTVAKLGHVLFDENTVRWSNFDRWDPKMEVFLKSTEATPCEHLLK
jgi:hypothetical protein